MSSLPLTERRTLVMHIGEATSFRLCIQSADESYHGRRLERYSDPAWWREQVQRFTNASWAGTIEIGACTGTPPVGWVYVREGDQGEIDDDASNAETLTSAAKAVVTAAAGTTCAVPSLTGRTQIWTGTVTVEALGAGTLITAYGFGTGVYVVK